MSSTQPGHNMPPESPTFAPRTAHRTILFAGVDRDISDAFMKLTEGVDYSLIVAGENNSIISLLLLNEDIALVVADIPDLINRCALGVLIKEYFPDIRLLLMSEGNFRDLLCTNCPVGCGASIVDPSRSLNMLMEAMRTVTDYSKICSLVQDEERPYSPHPDRHSAIALGYALQLVVIAAVAIASYFLGHSR